MQAKSPSTILKEFRTVMKNGRDIPGFHLYLNMEASCWLRYALSSVILWAGEEARSKPPTRIHETVAEYEASIIIDTVLNVYSTALKSLAERIVKGE